MKIGTILFTYHRSKHTKKVVEALSQNDVLPEKLYIFQDGPNESTNYVEWERVNRYIKSIDWCETELHISEKNKGLAKSVTTGVSYVLQECDAVIVLEDDCVPYKQFMRFMMTALRSYEKKEKVYSVSGYAWNVNLPYKNEDAYFNGKFCSWGWGTWKDRWNCYEENYQIVNEIKSNPETRKRFNIWGKTMESMIIGNVTGKCDSWAAFFGLEIIKRGGYCLSPYKQLVHNIGFDGTGVHGARQQEKQAIFDEELIQKIFHLPQEINSSQECEIEFQFLFGGKQGMEKMKLYQDILIQWILMKGNIQIPSLWKSGLAVWGKGKIFDCLFHEIKDQVKIKYIIESRPSINKYGEIPIVSVGELPEDIKNIIVIPYFDLDIIKAKVRKVRSDIQLYGINELFQ